MGASVVPILVFTILWGIVGIVLPFVVPKGPNRGILQVVLMLTAATCWLFWLCCYLSQINPLIGPKLSNRTVLLMAREWGNEIKMTG
ncbi:V-type proton ATPase subunit e 2-like [Zootermopsis nevadensis]|uniref:V-type proton ATPase subunit e 2-like n=1 Tax=Zootermopsis nevadensis TaxID=136037 RepID=UPI000B8E4D4E|nr:V-type proton ATPase subunit e 2-like [Zootermopsis nevadensis]